MFLKKRHSELWDRSEQVQVGPAERCHQGAEKAQRKEPGAPRAEDREGGK